MSAIEVVFSQTAIHKNNIKFFFQNWFILSFSLSVWRVTIPALLDSSYSASKHVEEFDHLCVFQNEDIYTRERGYVLQITHVIVVCVPCLWCQTCTEDYSAG